MKFCSHCGKEIMDEAVICVHCGCYVNSQNANQSVVNQNDAPNTGFLVLGIFIPILGLILYLANKDNYPLKAKSAGKGALIGFCIGVVISIIYSIIVGAAIGSMY